MGGRAEIRHDAGRRRMRTAVAGAALAIVGLGAVLSSSASGPSEQVAAPSARVSTAGETPASSAVAHPRPWDPREALGLPPAPAAVAPTLPEVIDPPRLSPPLREDPLGSARAVAVTVLNDRVQVLATDGRWRTVPARGRYLTARLSPGGARLVLTAYAAHDRGPVVVDLSSGRSRELPLPRSYRPFDGTSWLFIDDDTLLLAGGSRAWAVDAAAGTAEPLPAELGGGLSIAVDPSGGILVSAQWGGRNVLTDHRQGGTRRVSMASTGRLSALQADARTVVGTSYDGRPFGVVVADRRTLTPRVVLPITDRNAAYGNGGLGTIALTADGVVLLRVATLGRGPGGFSVVGWQPATGEISLVSRTKRRMQVDFATGLLRG